MPLTLQAQVALEQQQHADYISQLASEASQLSASASAQHSELARLETQHSSELALLISQHQSELESAQQQLTDTENMLSEQHASDLEHYEEAHKLMTSQLVTFLAWEKVDIALEASTSHEGIISSSAAQHEQQVDAVQAKMIDQSTDTLKALSESSEAAAQGLIAQTGELAQDLSELHRVEVETQQIAFTLRLQQEGVDHALSVQHLESKWESSLLEGRRDHEAALTEALSSAAQDSAQMTSLLSAHAVQLDALTAEHAQHLSKIAAQREQDRAESLSHLTQALEQLSQEYTHSLASAELFWTDAQTDQQQLHQQQLLDLSIQHESATSDVNNKCQERLQAAQAQHDTELGHVSAEHALMLCQLREDAESAQQLHAVQLVNLQLESEQAQHELRADVRAAQSELTKAVATYLDLQEQLQVCLSHHTLCSSVPAPIRVQ